MTDNCPTGSLHQLFQAIIKELNVNLSNCLDIWHFHCTLRIRVPNSSNMNWREYMDLHICSRTLLSLGPVHNAKIWCPSESETNGKIWRLNHFHCVFLFFVRFTAFTPNHGKGETNEKQKDTVKVVRTSNFHVHNSKQMEAKISRMTVTTTWLVILPYADQMGPPNICMYQ